jgi:hypothetical protein
MKVNIMIKEQIMNFCKSEIMSVCKADSKKQQKDCLFFEKSNCARHCMYFVFNEFCDNLKAQLYAVDNRLKQ